MLPEIDIRLWRRFIIWASLILLLAGGLSINYIFRDNDDTIAVVDDNDSFHATEDNTPTENSSVRETTIRGHHIVQHRTRRQELEFTRAASADATISYIAATKPVAAQVYAYTIKPGYYSFLHRYNLF